VQFARRTGRDHSVVPRHLRILNLPAEVISFLDENRMPEARRQLTARRRGVLAPLPEPKALRLFRQQATSLTRDECC
jgi:hypothetical protein